MEYNTYEDFIKVIKELTIPESVKVTLPWCKAHKLIVNPSDIRHWGTLFHEECANYGFIVEELGKKANYTYYKVREIKK